MRHPDACAAPRMPGRRPGCLCGAPEMRAPAAWPLSMSVVRRTMGSMNELLICERCDGSGTDPRQAYFDDEVTLCIECRGDGHLVSFEELVEELRLSA